MRYITPGPFKTAKASKNAVIPRQCVGRIKLRHFRDGTLVCRPGNAHRNTRHLVDDRLRRGDPDERGGGGIVRVDERLDLVHQIGDAVERTSEIPLFLPYESNVVKVLSR